MTRCALPLPRAKQPLTFANPHYLKTPKQNMISSLFTHRRGCIAARKPCGWVIVGGGINNLSEERYRRGTTERRYIAAPSGTVCPQQIDLTQFTAWGHINPITTKLVFMVFIEAGAFAGPQHLGHVCAQPQSLPRRFRHFSADNISASESTLHKEDEETQRLLLEVIGAYAQMRSLFICCCAIIASSTMSTHEHALTPQRSKFARASHKIQCMG